MRSNISVSYYDYYQPEAYVPASDTYIEKESSVNDEIDKLRHSATSALLERRDVIVVASVSSMYGLVNPEDYRDHVLSLREGMEIERDDLLRRLVEMQFERNDYDFRRGTFVFVGTSLKSSYQEMMRRPFVLSSLEMKSKRLKKSMC